MILPIIFRLLHYTLCIRTNIEVAGAPTRLVMELGVMKIPVPIVDPTTNAIPVGGGIYIF